MSRDDERRGRIRNWFSLTFGTFFSMGMEKDDPRYREMISRMRIQSRDLGCAILILVLIIVLGVLWVLLSS